MLTNPNDNIAFNMDAIKTIYLAGGCFWGVEGYMKRVKGVYQTQVGYANGKTEHPTYEEVCHSGTGHAETVKIDYDTSIIAIEGLLEEFFSIINPTSLNRQAGDVGEQYRTGIYYTDELDKQAILDFIRMKQKDYEKPIVTEVEQLYNFYEAEDYHQNYLEKNPGGYCHVDLSKFKA